MGTDTASEVWLERGAARYAIMTTAPLERAAVAAALSGAPVSGTVALSAEQQSALCELVSDFILHRFATDPGDYRSWLASIGADFLSVEQVAPDGTEDPALTLMLEDPNVVSSVTAEELFSIVLDRSTYVGGGVNRPVAIAAEPAGVCIATQLASDHSPPRLGCELQTELWYGPVAYRCRQWWTTLPNSFEPNISDVVADVGVVLEFRDGSRYPVTIRCLYHAPERRWHLTNCFKHNTRQDGVLGFEY